MRFLLRNLTSCSINKLTSLKFQVQLPIYNVRAIMHRLHDLTGNDDKSLKGESLVCFNFRTINTMKQLTLYYDLLLRGSPSFVFLYNISPKAIFIANTAAQIKILKSSMNSSSIARVRTSPCEGNQHSHGFWMPCRG